MQGVCATTGKPLAGYAHLHQSIQDILTTPINTRVMRREYGSDVPDLIDAPMNADTLIDVFAAVAVALDRWEPRFRLEQVFVTSAEPGHWELAVEGEYLPDGETIKLERIVL
ncbi:GPW/gp25 family protein [Desulfovibrio sp. JC010]|uniref:GPW/gp25 family protein n=1 Tax=Desulfovibrio sp. JC010 TaxID=2593641 RepID=UPI0013CFB2C6|nr:GPW/gp25 family protein [Desulfovibrio sp. JC010]NDV27716.1 phage baseplate protein [Desulfovibrio sp. JC010]